MTNVVVQNYPPPEIEGVINEVNDTLQKISVDMTDVKDAVSQLVSAKGSGFIDDLSAWVQQNKVLCIGLLGLSIAGTGYAWYHCSTSKKKGT